MHTLKMQRKYVQEVNYLCFDYAAHVHMMWIGGTSFVRHTSINFSLLAPVLLSTKSLALEMGNLFLLNNCLR